VWHDWPAPRLDKRKIDQISVLCRRVEFACRRSQRSYSSPRVRSLNSSTLVQASHALGFQVIMLPILTHKSLASLLQTSHPWSGPSSLKPQSSLQAYMPQPQLAAKRPSQIIWTPISTLLASYKPPKPPRARRKPRQASTVSSNWMAGERGPSIAASRRTC
jgi:hypothetical protein